MADKTEALGRMVMRLSHVAEGVDEAVDRELARIRDLIKSDASAGELDDASGHLTRTLISKVGIDVDKRRAGNGDAGYDLSGLAKLVKSMPVRGDEQERMMDLVEAIAAGRTRMERQKALVELLGTAAGALHEVSGRDRGERGMLGWLGKKSSEGGGERYVNLFLSLLQRLIEHLDVLHGNALRSHSIRESLDLVAHPEQAERLLEEITQEIETIDARIRAERSQTTDFLGDLRARLDGFEEVLGLFAQDGDKSLQRSESLQERVGADAREIGEATREGDVDALRALVDQGLARITERLAEHVIEERTQHAASQERVRDLTERLTALEEEADVLRSEIRNKNDLALKDALTGVYNRTGYEERALELFARWNRSGAALSLVFVDCNKFKEINDTFGHASGDLVLVKVADVLQGRARASDVVCRYGGDEFVILLPDTHVKGAEVFARSACEEIAGAGFNDNGRPLEVSISCGVTELVTGDTMESAIGRADEAMYQAKRMEGTKVAVVV
jgi:diguanylate cyclase